MFADDNLADSLVVPAEVPLHSVSEEIDVLESDEESANVG